MRPISQAVALGADRIYVLLAAYACALAGPPRSALAMAPALARPDDQVANGCRHEAA